LVRRPSKSWGIRPPEAPPPAAESHTIVETPLGSVLYMLSRNAPYCVLGVNYFDERWRHDTVDRLARCIEHLGYRVSLETVANKRSVRNFKATRQSVSGS
jgi:hypothetical protein